MDEKPEEKIGGTKRDDGGHAFPGDHVSDMSGKRWPHHGMTLRDYFAARVLPDCLKTANTHDGVTAENLAAVAAHMAYEIADGMIKVRAQ